MTTMAVQLVRPTPRVARRPRAVPAAAPLRLTRRARLLLTAVALLAVVVLAVLALGGPSAVAGTAGGGGGATATDARRVTVRPGETLWAIAQRVAPGTDPRATIAEILDLNALESSGVQVGQVLLLPR